MNSKFSIIGNLDADFQYPSENISLEFKTASFGLPKSFWETYSSFSNTLGGIIVLGIGEEPKYHYHVLGVDEEKSILTDFWNGIHNSQIISHVDTSSDNVQTIIVHGKTLICFYVPSCNYADKPVYIRDNKKNTYIRTDDGDRVATDQEFKYLVVDSQPEIDNGLLPNYGLDDLNLEDVHKYKQLLAEQTDDLSILNKNDKDFLIDVGVYKRDRQSPENSHLLTTGGLLFFGKFNSITDRFPHFQLDYFKYNGNSDSDWIDRVSSGDMNYPSLNIFSFYLIVRDKLPLGIPDKYTQTENMTRGSMFADLKLATKEALVNVLMHPYYDSDEPIKIIDRRDFFEFVNPGNMRVSKESFVRGQDSKIRNTVIANLFRKVGISEKAGSGGPRIINSAFKNHLHAPDINTGQGNTLIRIWKVDLLDSLVDQMDLTPEETKVIEFSTHAGLFKVQDVVDEVGLTYYKSNNIVKNLVDKELLKGQGRGRSRRYYLIKSEEQNLVERVRFFKQLEDYTSH